VGGRLAGFAWEEDRGEGEGGGRDALDERGRDGLAGPAPGGEGVHHDDVVGLEGGVELGLAVCLLAISSAASLPHRRVGRSVGSWTYLATLWTPMILAELLNPLKMCCGCGCCVWKLRRLLSRLRETVLDNM